MQPTCLHFATDIKAKLFTFAFYFTPRYWGMTTPCVVYVSLTCYILDNNRYLQMLFIIPSAAALFFLAIAGATCSIAVAVLKT